MSEHLSRRWQMIGTAIAWLHAAPAVALAAFLLWHAYARLAELWGAR